MKKILQKLLWVVVLCAATLTIKAENVLSLTQHSGHPGDTIEVSLSLVNNDAVVAFQVEIPLQGTLNYVNNSCVLSNRSNGHALTALVANGSLRIVSYSFGLNSYQGNSGVLATFKLILGNEPGTFNLTPNSAVISNAQGQSLALSTQAGSVTILSPKIIINNPTINFGRIPIRGVYENNISISNVGNEPLIINDLLLTDSAFSRTSSSNITIPAGGSNVIPIQYHPTEAGAVTRIATVVSNAINGSLNNTSHAVNIQVNLLANAYSVNELIVHYASGITDSIVTISLSMNNMDSITGMQCKFKLSNALQYIDNSFVLSERGNRLLSASGIQGDTLTLLAYSPTNAPFSGGEGIIGSFQVRLLGRYGYYLYPLSPILSTESGNNVLSDSYFGYVYIESPSMRYDFSSIDMGITSVTDTARKVISINNRGSAPLVIQQIVFDQNYYSIIETLPLTINRYNSENITIQYTGTNDGNYSANMKIYSNDPDNGLVHIPIYGTRYEFNTLIINTEDSIPYYNDVPITISMDNNSDITAIQFDLQYSSSDYSFSSPSLQVLPRAANHIQSATQIDSTTWRILLFSMFNQPITGNSGDLIKFSLHPIHATPNQNYTVSLANIVLSDLNSENKYSALVTGIEPDGINDQFTTTCPTVFTNLYDTICQGDPYNAYGFDISVDSTQIAGTFVKTVHEQSLMTGCDSIITLYLTINPTYYYQETAETCYNVPYLWDNHNINIGLLSPGTYTIWDSLQTINGCDSVYKLTLTVNQTYFYQETAETCDNVPYIWNNHIVNIDLLTAGTYTIWDSLQTVNGCDSVYKLTLTVNQTYYYQETAETCDNVPYLWNDHNVNIGLLTAGTYTIWDSLQTINGCDSVYKLTLTVNTTYYYEESAETCDNVPYLWDNHNVNIGLLSIGTHTIWDSLQTVNGCDSVYKLTLTVNQTYFYQETAETCDNVPYIWNNHNLNIGLLSAGTHTIWDSLQTVNGCDSVYKLTLTVNPTYYYEETAETCDNIPYIWNNHNVNIGLLTAGTYTIWDSLQTINGCDSVYKLTLTVNPTYFYQETAETCDNVPYIWINHNLNIGLLSAGTYTIWDSLQTVNGCDSVYKLTLTVNQTYFYQETAETCDNVPYIWNNHNLNIGVLSSGTYTIWDSLQTVNGCDSVYKLTLTVNQTYYYQETAETCDNVPYLWNDHNVNIGLLTAGTYTIWDSLQTINGCDSVYKLTLTVNTTYYYEESAETCDNVPYIWINHNLNIGLLSAGTYTIWDSLQTVNGCDSVYKLTLTVNQTYFYQETAETCDNVPYIWNNHNLNIGVLSSGTYTIWDSLQTVNGCDSVYKLTLTVNQTYYYQETAETCDNVLYLWNDHNVNIGLLTAGTYTIWDSLQTINGCDSVYKLTLTVNTTYYYEESAETCDNVPYLWDNHNVNIDLLSVGTYTIWDSLQTINGCDSVYKLTLTVNQTYYYEETAETCDNVPYSWNNHNLNIGVLSAGTHTIWDSLQTVNGCDSVYKLTLTVNQTYYYQETAETCDNIPYIWNNHNINIGVLSANTYTIWDSLQTINGCDSVYKLTLTVNPTYYIEEEAETCDNVPFLWNNHNVNIDLLSVGTHTIWDSLQTISGCDSVYKLTLTVNQTYYYEETAETCDNIPYIWINHNVNINLLSAGTHTIWDSLQTVNGCDSVYKLTLTVNPTYYYEETAETCDNVPYIWNNHNVNIGLLSAGTYTIWDSLQTVNGCDSVYKLTLTVNPTLYIEINDQVCQGEPYNGNGFNIPADSTQMVGTFFETVHATSLQTGCDSVVTLNLTINPTYYYEETAETCDNVPYLWNNHNVNIGVLSAGTHTIWDSLQTVNGCDSVYKLTLTVNPTYYYEETAETCDNVPYIWNNHNVNIGVLSAGTHTIWDSLQTVNGCDSVYKLTLTVYPTYYIEINDQVCQGEPYNGNGFNIPADSTQMAGTFSFSHSSFTSNGCDSIAILLLTVHPLPTITITGNTTIQQGESTTLTAYGADTYLWNTADIGPSIVVSPPTTTQYSVTGTDSYGCVGNATVEVTVTVGIRNVDSQLITSLQLFPNPATTHITLQTTNNANITNIEIIDVMGKLLITNNGAEAMESQLFSSPQSRTINVSNLPAGTYFARITLDKNTTMTKKFIIE